MDVHVETHIIILETSFLSMGVMLREIVPKTEIPLAALEGKIVAIDALNALYQFLAIIRQRDGTPLMDSKGRITSHLSGIFYRTCKLLEAGVKPVYVFDGKPPLQKKHTLEKRSEAKTEAGEKWEAAREREDFVEARKYAQASVRITDAILHDARQLLDAMGVPWIQAPSEGEAQASHMCAKGDAYAVGSQDYDALLFGAPVLIRNLTLTGKRKLPKKNIYVDINIEKIILQETLASLGIGREQLVTIGLLVGTDFCPGIKGIGPKKALDLVKKTGSLDRVLKEIEWNMDIPASEIANIFLKPDVTDDYKLGWQEPNQTQVTKLLCDEHEFSEERVTKALEAVVPRPRQKSLNSFF